MKKRIVLLAVLALALIMSTVLVACEHVHSFADEWTYDATDHWHKATCEHSDEIDGKAPHNMVGVPGEATKLQCDVCGYSTNAHVHTYEGAYTADSTGHWFKATCGHDVVKDKTAHSYTEGICDVCGWWSSATDVLLIQASKLNCWNYTLTVDKLDLSALTNEPNAIINGGELKLNINSDGKLEGYGSFTMEQGVVNAVVKDGLCYMCAEGNGENESDYKLRPVEDVLKAMNVDVEQVKSAIDELNANTAQIREAVEALQEYVNKLPPMDEDDKNAVAGLWQALVKEDAENSTDKLTAYVLSTDVLRSLNDMLATKTMTEYIDGAFGEGFLASVPTLVENVMAMKVGDVLDMLEEQYGMTADDVIDMINAAIKENYPDEKVNTIEDLLAAMDIDLGGETVKSLLPLMRKFTLGGLIEMAQDGAANKVTVEQIVALVTNYVEGYANSTVYQIMSDLGVAPNAEAIAASVTEFADMLDECVAVRFFIDKNGVLQKVTVSVDFPAVEDSEDNGEDNAEDSETLASILAGLNGQISFVLGFESEVDYDAVVNKAIALAPAQGA